MSKPNNCKCKYCEKEFYLAPSKIKLGKGKFCSRPCRESSVRVNFNCEVCNKTIVTTKSKLNNHYSGKYCSSRCRSTHNTKIVNCKNCNTPNKVKNSVFNRGFGRYCNFVCRGEYKTKLNTIDKKCPECDIIYRARKSQIERGYSKFCSRECNSKHKTPLNETYFKRNPKEKDKPAIVYLIEFDIEDVIFQKIGITTKELSHRWRKNYNYKVLDIKECGLYEAYKIEQDFKKYNKGYKYYPETLPAGKTECFIHLPITEIKQYPR